MCDKSLNIVACHKVLEQLLVGLGQHLQLLRFLESMCCMTQCNERNYETHLLALTERIAKRHTIEVAPFVILVV